MEKSGLEDRRAHFKRTSIKVLILLFVNATLWLLGSLMFIYLEGPSEAAHKCGVKRVRRDFLDTLWEQSGSLDELEWKSLARKRLETFEEEIHTAVEAGVKSYSSHDVWTPSNALLYTFTLATTIGYGSLTPSSIEVRLLSMVYAGVSCPLLALLLGEVSLMLKLWIQYKVDLPQSPDSALTVRSTFTLLMSYMVVGSLFFSLLYSWSLKESAYFLSSTVTTIGFGDILPEDSFIFLLLGVYILLGLALYSLFQETVMEKYSGCVDHLLRRIPQKQHKE